MSPQRGDDLPGQHRAPVTITFPLPHRDLGIGEIDISYAQAQAFQQAQTSAIEQFAHESNKSAAGHEKR